MLADHPFLPKTSRLVLADYVTMDSGTGCVHTAPGFGADDYQTCRRYGMDMVVPVDDQGRHTDYAGKYAGMKTEESNPVILADMKEAGVLVHGDARVLAIAEAAGLSVAGDVPDVVLAGEADWETEYLGPELAVKCVEGLQEAIDHVNRYGTKHSEAIVASDEAAQDAFLAQVDAAAVYANASTAFTDGGQFGLGAEIGISTQKMHARGPMGLTELTSSKYIIYGSGQVR